MTAPSVAALPDVPRVDLLAIAAHPDDVELTCGGTIARTVDQGHRVGILDLSGGESGSRGSGEIRAREASAAAGVLGVSARANAGLPDAALENTPETRREVARWLRAFRPRVVILPPTEGRHPDHRIASRLGYDACFLAGLARLPIPGDPHRPVKVLYALAYREEPVKPTFVVDVTDWMDRKVEAIACFRSQFEGKSWAGEVFAGGDRPLAEQVRMHAARYGSLIRRPYGEPFLTVETMEVADVTALGVASI